MPTIRTLNSDAITPFITDLASLRITVFREFPYLYDGDLAYERDYLSHYAAATDSIVVLALENDRIIGASTGLPLQHADAGFRAPFGNHSPPVGSVFYFGESVLLPQFRGRGLGHSFFDARESHARSLGRFSHTAFCAVDRPPDHPHRPSGYRDLDQFWRKRGYHRCPGLQATFPWKEIGSVGEVENTLTFYLHEL